MERKKQKLFAALLWIVAILLVAISGIGLAGARASAAESYFCDDGIFAGEGETVSATYTITCDSYVQNEDYRGWKAPSYTPAGNSTMSNYCSVLAGMNVIGYYDRYYTDLIPNYEPGLTTQNGFFYLPNLGEAQLKTVFTTLYSYMRVNVDGPGATKADFKNGLSRYVQEQKHSVSYTSFYKSSTNVNLTKMQQMAAQNKVGVLFLNRYNFVYGFGNKEGSRTVYMSKANIGHMMMVFGYITVDYYKNGSKFLSETYLEASSCVSTAEQGYIKMDDYLQIEDALIINIS
jgi:hypothetical protein